MLLAAARMTISCLETPARRFILCPSSGHAGQNQSGRCLTMRHIRLLLPFFGIEPPVVAILATRRQNIVTRAVKMQAEKCLTLHANGGLYSIAGRPRFQS